MSVEKQQVESQEFETVSVEQEVYDARERHIDNLVGDRFKDASESEETITETTQPQPPEEAAKETKSVPLSALHEERERRKELKAELENVRRQQMEMEAQLRQYMTAVTPKEENVPDPDTDPLGALSYNLQKINERQAQIEEWRAKQTQIEQQTQYEAQLRQRAAAVAQEYTKANPAFPDAYAFVQKSRIEELQALGYNQDQAAAIYLDNEKAIVEKALQEGANPAERIYKLAQVRGFRPGTAEQPTQQKIKQIDEGLKASKSLSGGGAAQQYSLDNISAVDLASLSDKEFDALYAKARKAR